MICKHNYITLLAIVLCSVCTTMAEVSFAFPRSRGRARVREGKAVVLGILALLFEFFIRSYRSFLIELILLVLFQTISCHNCYNLVFCGLSSLLIKELYTVITVFFLNKVRSTGMQKHNLLQYFLWTFTISHKRKKTKHWI